MKKVFLLFFITILNIFSQSPTKEIKITRIDKAPVIDGIITPGEWQHLPLLTDFIQYNLNNGQPSGEKSDAWVGYDNNALYIGAFFYDSDPSKITRYISDRDSYDPEVNDLISLIISPYEDKNNAQGFMVTATNIQYDRKLLPDGSYDQRWDAVWQSATNINDKGWSVEIRIPFSALRFPSKDIQDWGFNLWRRSVRNAEWSTWSYADNSTGNYFSYYGKLKEFENITPPVRLSFSPYVSGYIEKNDRSKWGRSYNLGMDVKYGINESFTLDMILVPDFSQVQTDDQQLNLSPYEIQYNEKRQFFTEGTELFNKGNIFYSRRIGSRPVNYNNVYGSLSASDTVKENPIETKLINAIKLSGRTQGGLGIGIFNAMTSQSEAEIFNKTSGLTRKIETQPFTNYNMLVFDYKVTDNSYISFANTNVKRTDFMANVSALDFRLATKENSYEVKGIATYSYRDLNSSTENGYSLYIKTGKINGEFKYYYSLNLFSDKYNRNDMGYLQRNNEVINQVRVDYNIYKPFSIFNNFSNAFVINYSRLYNPDRFTDFNIAYQFTTLLKNQMYISMHAMWQPMEKEDYYEARVPGKKVNLYKKLHNCFSVNTDSRAEFVLNNHGYINASYDYITDYLNYGWYTEVIWKYNNKLNFNFGIEYGKTNSDVGYAGRKGNNIYFGERNVKLVSNTLTVNYILNNEINFSIRARHYWSEAKYLRFFNLQDNGSLVKSDYKGNHDLNYNAFNIDASFKWIFLPGSELSLMWKNSIYTSDSRVNESYFKNLSEVMDNPQSNSFSMKILYYLDYNSIF